MASALDSGSRSPGSSLAVDIMLCCVVGQDTADGTLSASLDLHPGVETDTGEYTAG